MAVLSHAAHRPSRHSRHCDVHVSWLLADANRHYRRRTNLHLGTSKALQNIACWWLLHWFAWPQRHDWENDEDARCCT